MFVELAAWRVTEAVGAPARRQQQPADLRPLSGIAILHPAPRTAFTTFILLILSILCFLLYVLSKYRLGRVRGMKVLTFCSINLEFLENSRVVCLMAIFIHSRVAARIPKSYIQN